MSDYSVFVGTQVKDRCDFCSTPIDDDNKYFDGEGDLELCEKCFYKVAPIPQQTAPQNCTTNETDTDENR